MYTFAENQLSKEDLADIDARSKKFEDEETEKGIQKHYLDMLAELEKKYIQS